MKVINFPKLGYKERYLINQHRLRFDEASEYRDFGVLGRQRVVSFLKNAYKAFDKAGVWKDEVKKVTTSGTSQGKGKGVRGKGQSKSA